MRTCGWRWATAFAVAFSATASLARAEAPGPKVTPVYVLTIDTDDSDDQAAALTASLRAQVKKAPGFSLLETDQSLGTLLAALKCPPKPDATCLERIGEQLRGDHFIWGQMQKSGGKVTSVLHLWSRGRPDVTDTAQFADTLMDPNAHDVAASAEHAVTVFAGRPPAAPPAALPSTREEPAAGANHPTEGNGTQPSQEVHSGGSSARVIVADVLLGVGAVGVIVGIAEGVRFYGERNDLDSERTSVPSNVADVCNSNLSAAVIACSDYHLASTIRTEEFVALGIGAAAAITGVVLIAIPSGDSRDDSRGAAKGPLRGGTLQFAPVLSGHEAGGVLFGTF